jgi:hypothetical protein
MVLELIRAEWDRRRLPFLLLLAVWLAVPLRYVAALSGGVTADEVTRAAGSLWIAPWLMVFAAAAWGSGAWAPERKGRWAWFLALSVDRVRLFALRYAAGLAWMAAAVGALVAASYAVAAAAALPFQVFAYPGAFAAWALVAGWTAYTAGFLAGARWEHPGRVGGAALVALVAATYLMERMGMLLFLDRVLYGSSPLRLLVHVPHLLGG